MCGISGIVYFNDQRVNHENLRRFNDELVHRGPDSEGVFIDKQNNLGLAHRRLAILDLSSGGHQPMPFNDENYWIVFNGEIFNFLELKAELSKLGYTFRSTSDTEIILAAYQEWGEKCVGRFNGMWAFCIYDKKSNHLFLSRDRFGIKPLHFVFNKNKMFAFASETVAFDKLEGYKKEIDSNNLLFNIERPYSLEATGHTIYNGISQLKAGCNIKLNLDNRELHEYEWWNTLNNLVEVPDNFIEQAEEFRALFEDATRIRMRADVPLASALSGGLDSSAVYCTINYLMERNEVDRYNSNWQSAFNIGYPGSLFDESNYAKEVIEYTKGKGVYLVPNENNLVDEIVSSTLLFDNIYNLPIYGATKVYEAMNKRGFKISMDGHGVDEMMYGYSHQVKFAYEEAKRSNDLKSMKTFKGIYSEMFPASSKMEELNRLDSVVIPNSNNPSIVSRAISKVKRELFKVDQNKGWYNQKYEPLPLETKTNRNWSPVEQSLFESFHHTILPTILRNFDRAGMQKSMELRMPFMDWRLVSYVFSLPLSSKLGDGFTKRVLRESMRGRMPETIRQRTIKVGMSSPLPDWFGNQLKSFIMDEITSNSFHNNGLFNSNAVIAYAETRMKNNSWKYGECTKFWSLLNAHILMKNNND
jgi:asparagine synthase (glutamine-hydrolysing)